MTMPTLRHALSTFLTHLTRPPYLVRNAHPAIKHPLTVLKLSLQGTALFLFFDAFLPLPRPPETIRVTGQSMAPVLSPRFNEAGEYDYVQILRAKDLDLWPRELSRGRDVLMKKSRPRLERGQIIAFRSPRNAEREVIKRVVAVEGDVVAPRRAEWATWMRAAREGGSPMLRIEVVLKESGCLRARSPAEDAMDKKYHTGADEIETIRVTVPFGHVWVEGENAEYSLDSNMYGPISKALITGKVHKVYPGSGWFKGTPKEMRWEDDGWEKRWRGRVQWNDRQGVVPDEWSMAF